MAPLVPLTTSDGLLDNLTITTTMNIVAKCGQWITSSESMTSLARISTMHSARSGTTHELEFEFSRQR